MASKFLLENVNKENSIKKKIEDQQNKIIDVKGVVKDIGYDNTYSIYNKEYDELNNVKCINSLPIRKGDLFYGVGKVENDSKLILLNRDPIVLLPTDKISVIDCFVDALKGRRVGNSKSKKLFEHIVNIIGSVEVSKYMDVLSYQYHITGEKSLCFNLTEVLNENQSIILLLWWYINRCLRRLFLFGLTKKEIELSFRDPDDLYIACTTDPFLIMSIDMDKAKRIYSVIEKTYTPDQKRRGKIIRSIFNNTINKSWMGTPVELIIKQYPDIVNHINALYNEHRLAGDLSTLYLVKYYKDEKICSEIIYSFIKKEHSPFVTKNRKIIYKKNTLSDNQKEAIKVALDENISIITGGAGTGKTTIIGEIVYNLEKYRIPYQIVSFTGKAVSRIKEVIHRNNPSTLHKMIYKNYTQEKFEYLIIDESSMVTIDLFNKFYEIYNINTGFNYKIILIGDNNQLEPIQAGSMFSELIKSKLINNFMLKENFRNDSILEQNGIISNSEKIIDYHNSDHKTQGSYVFQLQQYDNFLLISGDIDSVFVVVTTLKENGSKCDDITVVCPYNEHINELNTTIQMIFDNGEKRYIEYVNGESKIYNPDVETSNKINKYPKDQQQIKRIWKIGDRIMNKVNNYDIDKMNGEEGKIIDIFEPGTPIKLHENATKKQLQQAAIDSNYTQLLVRYKDGLDYRYICRYRNKNEEDVMNTIDCITLSYALTVHKSQGSEWNFVISYIPYGHENSTFLNYKLVYTMITRARNAFFAIGDIDTLNSSAIRDTPYRCDNLSKRIKLLSKN
jgi:exodeoxyribonuclease V alpha subunit